MHQFKNEAEVETYYKETGIKAVIFEGIVYDVENYMSQHPGGEDKIEEYLGKCIDDPFEEAEHSKAARNIFKDLRKIGFIDSNTKNSIDGSKVDGLDGIQLESKIRVDYTKGLFAQLLNANMQWDDYIKFINEPKHLINPTRDIFLFDNPYLEFLTKTPWYGIPLAYIPLITYFLLSSDVPLMTRLAIAFFGLVFWTLTEYAIHRFLFHAEDYWLPNNPNILTYHFVIHGIHHAFPMDRLRLVFPILPGLILFTLLFLTPCRLFFSNDISNPWLGGLLIGYLCYDMIHYFMHHGTPKSGYWRDLKVYHMQHHYKNGLTAFGVTSKFWDYVFFTYQ